MLKLVENDGYLQPHEHQINERHQWFLNTLHYIQEHYGSLSEFADRYRFLGFNTDEKNNTISFREWLPHAKAASLVGEFNNWDRNANPLYAIEYGNWEIILPKGSIPVNSKVKLAIQTSDGNWIYKIPAYIEYVIQNEDLSYDGIYIAPSQFQWTDTAFTLSNNFRPIIYETHIGMATEDYKVGTYNEFTAHVLPYIKDLGYNAIQLMAIQEHPYYGSFGYQVANFYAPSSRFGTPDDLRNLINTAHQMGIAVILDVVHSHSVKNEMEGLSHMDGTDIYFNGTHPDWDSKLFDYSKIEVKQFLVSNIKYWMEEFHFDGFRFDGVTSMLYHHFGHIAFDHYNKYFENTNNDAIIYLQLANTLIDIQHQNKISICEDMSGMPGACVPISDGGLGFDYRLGMGFPDFWMDLLENVRDEDWNMTQLFARLTDRRLGEKTIAYVESHDQALVGDKTTAFWLMDKEMYTHMSKDTPSAIIDRGVAMHELIRFVTILLGGEGYMTFIGNEFGHPEWVDFPREGNDFSYQYARRQWSLVHNESLRYQELYEFDKAMIHFVKAHDLLESMYIDKVYEHNEDKVLIFKKRAFYFVFNFSAQSYYDYHFPLREEGTFEIVFTSDEKRFGGFDRVDRSQHFHSENHQLKFYLPSRSVWVLKRI